MTQRDETRSPDADAEIEDLEVAEQQAHEVLGGGKVNVQDIQLTKQTDSTSPKLF